MNIQESKILAVFSDVKNLRKNKEGSWTGLCPFHDDKKRSFGIKQYEPDSVRFKCFACDKSGSIYDYLRELKGMQFKEAYEYVHGVPYVKNTNDENTDNSMKPKQKTETSQKDGGPKVVKLQNSKQIRPVPKDAPPPPKVANSTQVHAYLNEKNELIGYVFRIDKGEQKTFLPCVYTEKGWEIRGFDPPYPLYGLQFASETPEIGPVMVCEGEKTADAIRTIFGFPLCVTWPGGANAYKKADWTPILRFKNVIICPDADEVGLKNAKELCAYLHFEKGINNVRLFIPPANWPKKTDWADLSISREEARQILKENLAATDHRGNFTIKGLDIEPVDNLSSSRFFSIIGQRIRNGKTEIAFHRNGIGIIYMSPDSISPKNLFQLAPAEFWKSYDPNYHKPANQLKLIDQLFRMTSKLPILTEDSIRGIGVWRSGETNDVVINDGGTVRWKDNVRRGTCIYEGHVYECGTQSDFYNISRRGLYESEIQKVVKVFSSISAPYRWSHKILAGWAYCAPICGILSWRPHIWITGRAGAGKSFIMDFIRRLLKGCCANFQGSTTEAAIRQTINNTARPILIDEFDPSSEKNFIEQNNIVAFARACSSGDSPPIVKGSSSGQATYYTAKSMVIIGSIVPRLENDSDLSRFSVIELQNRRKNDSEDSLIYELSHDDTYNYHWFSTVYYNLDVFHESLKKYRQHILSRGYDHRFADQHATLLAGWTALSKQTFTYMDFEEFFADTENMAESKNMQSNDLMNVLMTTTPRGMSAPLGTLLRNAYELFKRDGGYAVIKGSDCEHALNLLANIGIKYMPDKDTFYLSRSQFVIETFERIKQPINTSLKLMTYHESFQRMIVTKITPGSPTTRCYVFTYRPDETQIE